MATRAFSNVQPTIWNRTKKDLLVQTCASNNAGMKAIKVQRGMPHAYLPRTRELWGMKYSV